MKELPSTHQIVKGGIVKADWLCRYFGEGTPWCVGKPVSSFRRLDFAAPVKA